MTPITTTFTLWALPGSVDIPNDRWPLYFDGLPRTAMLEEGIWPTQRIYLTHIGRIGKTIGTSWADAPATLTIFWDHQSTGNYKMGRRCA